jgi:hypothetical protein
MFKILVLVFLGLIITLLISIVVIMYRGIEKIFNQIFDCSPNNKEAQ